MRNGKLEHSAARGAWNRLHTRANCGPAVIWGREVVIYASVSGIRYMGNKHALAQDVVRMAAAAPTEAPLVDVFCGMGSIGQAFSTVNRPVWGNDIQEYAALAGRCTLSSDQPPLTKSAMRTTIRSGYDRNRRALRRRFAADLAQEAKVLLEGDHAGYRRLRDRWQHAANNSAIAAEVRQEATARSGPHRLATLTYAWGYFGLAQAVELDSLRFALDEAKAEGRMSADEFEWGVLAVLETASAVAASSGHFAQYLRGETVKGFARVRRQRARPVWSTFLSTTAKQEPVGTRAWRRQNQIFCGDALAVWSELDRLRPKSAVVYADPPYSKDHYSRFYHVLESLVLYDYPTVAGAGRYREHRFATPFSIKSLAPDAFSRLFRQIAEREWTIILSYPSNGLLSAGAIQDSLSEHFRHVRLDIRRDIKHSTLGARHGVARNDVQELMWTAT